MTHNEIFAAEQISLAKEKFPDSYEQVITALSSIASLMIVLGPARGKFVLEVANKVVERFELTT